MLVTYTTPNGRVKIEQDIPSGKIAFEFISRVQELFEEESCGCCGSKGIAASVREYDGNKYYKYVCHNAACGAQLDFGQHKEGGTLFVKRWDSEAKCNLPNNGWYIYQKDGQTNSNTNSNATERPGQRSDLKAGGGNGNGGRQKESADSNVIPF